MTTHTKTAAKPAPKTAARTTAKQVAKSTESATKSAIETAESVSVSAAAAAEPLAAVAKEQVETTRASLAASFDDLTAAQKEGVDAFVAAGTVLAKGVEDLTKAYFAFAQETAVANSEAAKALLTAKSLKEIVDLQSDFARKSFDKSISEGTRFSELSLKIANEAFQPIQAQFTTAVEKALKPLAA